jgi:tetrahydromethanopterin S-methyltransferase subunit B
MIWNGLTKFAAEADGPPVHITPGELFEVAGITVTNSMFYGIIVGIIILILSISVARRVTVSQKEESFSFLR